MVHTWRSAWGTGDAVKIPANKAVSLKHLEILINQPRGVFNYAEGINSFL